MADVRRPEAPGVCLATRCRDGILRAASAQDAAPLRPCFDRRIPNFMHIALAIGKVLGAQVERTSWVGGRHLSANSRGMVRASSAA